MQNHSLESSSTEMMLRALHDSERQFEDALDLLGERNEINGEYSFVSLPSDRRWKTFMDSARHLRYLDVGQGYIPILGMIINIAHTHGSYPFPNLRSLKWTARSNRELIDISSFLVPSLVNICLELHDLPPLYLNKIYQSLTARVFTLQSLRIGLPDHVQIVPQVVQILANLLTSYSSTLTQVQIPTVLVIPPIIHCLSRISNLRGMNLGYASAILPLPGLVNSSQYAPSNRQGFFLSLRDFLYHGTPQNLYNTFFRVFDLTALSVFRWDLEDGLDNLKEFLGFIELSCPRLTTLTLGHSTMYLLNRRKPPVVSWDAIQGLLECRYLTAVSIYCARVDMKRSELATLLRSRTTWKKVEIYTRRPLKLEDMFLYGKYCPNLTSLGMYLDLFGDESDLFGRPLPITIPQLHELDLGHTKINPDSSFQIGVFLYKISGRPVYVQGLHYKLWQEINEAIVFIYTKYETQSGRRLSDEVREYISTVQMDGENLMDSDDDPNDDR